MVEKLQIFMANSLGDIFYEDEVSNLLKFLEEAGMKPPEALFKGDGKGCLCTMRESCSSCGGLCNEWEPENGKV